jgi:hypothetical protein
MTNIIGFGRTQLQPQSDPQLRGSGHGSATVHTLRPDTLGLSDEASKRLEGLPPVDAPELTRFSDAMKMARNTVQMILERPEQARISHVPDLGARAVGLVA